MSGNLASDRRVVAIHQPNFFPWLGYFDKIARSDVFVVLDHVQFPKTRDGNWLNRVKAIAYGSPVWMTIPLVRGYEGFRRIDEMRIDNRVPWRRRMVQSLHDSYRRASAFDEEFPLIRELIENPTDILVDYNLSAISGICGRLGLSTAHWVRSASLGAEGSKTDLLVAVVKGVGGNAYLAGGGASGYQDDSVLTAAGIEVQHQDFQPRPYAQGTGAEFVGGLSVLDALLHRGAAGTSALIGTRHGSQDQLSDAATEGS